MKKVFSNAHDVMHVFAQRTQDEGRSSNVFFYRDKLYSYGHHYLLAEFIKNPDGQEAVMLNDRGYSSTTVKHIWWAANALRQYKVFRTESTTPKTVRDKLVELVNKLARARKPEIYIRDATSLYDSYIEFRTWSKSEEDYFHQEIETLHQVFLGNGKEEYLALIKERELQDKLKREKLHKENLIRFFNYETDWVDGAEDFIRVSQNGEYIETTQNVRVDIKEARVLYKLIKSGRPVHGHRIANYTVQGLNGVLSIGCHRINKDNMIEIGEKIIQ